MLGGPQAGILLGEAALIDACRRNPLARALRVDKLTLAALEATLALYRDPERAVRDVPILAMITAPAERVRLRANRVAGRLTSLGVTCDVVPTEASVGGGAFPTARIESSAVAIAGDAVALEARLRARPVPIIGRIAEGRLLLDVRSVPESADDEFGEAVAGAFRA
jgi:L-seryl-tRNA(Ser) seleniumtransferase